MPVLASVDDYRRRARKRLPRPLFDYLEGGSEDELTLQANRTAFESIKFSPRTLVDVSKRSQEITLFGHKQKMPICIVVGSDPITFLTSSLHQIEDPLTRGAALVTIWESMLEGRVTRAQVTSMLLTALLVVVAGPEFALLASAVLVLTGTAMFARLAWRTTWSAAVR